MKKKEVIPDKKIFFISYRRDTSGTLANAIVDKLVDKYKFEVFFDKHNRTFGEVKDKLKNNIDKCTHFILFVDEKTFDFNDKKKSETNQGKDGNYVLFEIQNALEKRKNNEKSIEIIPILVNGNKMPDENDERLIKNNIEKIAGFEWIDYDEIKESHNDVTEKILNRIGYHEFQAKEDKKRKLKQSIFVILSTIVAVAALLYGGTLLQQWYSSRAPKLIFAGGGSVANIIKEITGDAVDVKDYKNSIYLNLPSKDAWALMPQELITSHTSDGNKFYPVCLSALRAKDSVFTKTVYNIKDFKERGTIIEYKFKNEDLLKVYVDSVKRIELGHLKDSLIQKDILNSKIIEWCKDKSFKIYITRERSGTYCIYEDLFPDIFKDSTKCKDNLTFYDERLSITNLKDNGNNYIVLSSLYYTPDSISKLDSIGIVDKGKILSKSMYLYFVAYRDPDKNVKGNRYIIPDVMVRFFKRIESNITIAPIMSNNEEWKVVTPIESLYEYKPPKISEIKTKPSKSK